MQLMGFTFPPDIRRTAKTLDELPVEYMLRIRRTFKDNYEAWINIFDSYAERIIDNDCQICDRKSKLSYDDIPKDWGWYDIGSCGKHEYRLMCDKCQALYKKKFGKAPNLLIDLTDEFEVEGGVY